jgi:hypothetical protein
VLQRPSDPISAVVPINDPTSVPDQWHDHNTSLVADMNLNPSRPIDPAPPPTGASNTRKRQAIGLPHVSRQHAGKDILSNWEVLGGFVKLFLRRGHYCRHSAYSAYVLLGI